jgi:CLIP-associating protein 1/2
VTLGTSLDPFVDVLLSNLLRMAGFTKKIAAQTSQLTVGVVMTKTSPQPRTIVPLFWTCLQDKTAQGRAYAIEHVKTYLDFHGLRAKSAVEASGLFDTLEKCIRKALTDPNAGVRQNARAAFWTFEGMWKERGRVVLEAQDGPNRKQLEKACPNQQALPNVQPTTPTVKKSSVAAAIAASRAKARAIATAPPTLRHQATSAARTMSPPKRSLSPSLSTGSVSGKAAPSSPSAPPRSRILSNPGLRTGSGNGGTRSHSRTSSGDSSNSASYPGSRVVPAPFSSPPRGSVLRRAMQTALPSSPPPQPANDTPPSPASQRFAEIDQRSTSFARQSVYLPDFDEPDSSTNDLLTAVAIPLPDDGDSDMDETNLISFSSPYEKFPPRSGSKSRTDSQSPTSSGHQPVLNPLSNTASLPVNVPQPVVEDALRARAEQAQSAAERLLELVEPEDEVVRPQPSLLLNNGTASKTAKIRVSVQAPQTRMPTTPVSKNSAIWKQAAAFRDSPAHQAAPSLMTDMLRPTTKADGAWWKKRMACMCRSSFRSAFLISTLPLQCSINAILFLLPAPLMRPPNCRGISLRSTRALGMYRH